jgi:plasmid stability protein
MLVEWLTALQELAPVAALRSARWTYAAVNATHILGIALLVGAIVPLDLRLVGCFRQISIRTLARVLVPVAVFGLLLAIAAGSLLFSIRAVQYAGTTLFQIKMALVACGIANALLLRKATSWETQRSETSAIPPPRLRAAGALSIILWLSVIACGRFVSSDANGGSMTPLLVRKIDERSMRQLRRRAAQSDRSLEDEVLTILRNAVEREARLNEQFGLRAHAIDRRKRRGS